eukprot:CAMPEP_0180383058 /NCGR_PEP_ID=MMETSP0989-20121125/27717_1 /TAXON_ID=697907 /ORGANISM="non described non described, Strain CCMP2293" /LENGTH=62 /DNA_ID=CAMNT_0022383257 /DNA_START=282 /DNA_END=467 /DNA_ORIENTATION=-
MAWASWERYERREAIPPCSTSAARFSAQLMHAVLNVAAARQAGIRSSRVALVRTETTALTPS